MNARELILGRVREALSVPSDEAVKATAGQGVRDAREARGFLPPGGEGPEGRLRRFQELAAKLKAEVRIFADIAEAKTAFEELRALEGWSEVASHHHALTDSLLQSGDVLWVEDQPAVEVLEAMPAGITACEALIAQTGSVLVTNRGCGGRALSVLPPVHLVIAGVSQLLGDMLDGFDLLKERYGDRPPSLISFITGASRTGDIERILVLGAHGPKRLLIWLIQDA